MAFSLDPMEMLIKTFATPEKLKGLLNKVFTPEMCKNMAAGIAKKFGTIELLPGELPQPIYSLRVVNDEMKFAIVFFKEHVIFNAETGKQETLICISRTLDNLSFNQFINQFFPEKKPDNNSKLITQ